MKTTLFVIKTVIPALSGGMEILPDTRILLRRMLFRCVVCGEGSGRQTWQQIVKDLYQHVLSGDLDDSKIGPCICIIPEKTGDEEGDAHTNVEQGEDDLCAGYESLSILEVLD
ncbi:hypothetical protein M422DRAFT_785967 [Sphaerobolus stellatus SS14]|uniref:Uncharacterized protein n=1 Tax=Sphaerobolus stellatus (strain SS14) TaxID=990650 RepID=A0A0C9U4M1_SPHS4|nr:hypothetical protein M422DRAFT_785967 [Sphaerobolus stellatus SS14]